MKTTEKGRRALPAPSLGVNYLGWANSREGARFLRTPESTVGEIMTALAHFPKHTKVEVCVTVDDRIETIRSDEPGGADFLIASVTPVLGTEDKEQPWVTINLGEFVADHP